MIVCVPCVEERRQDWYLIGTTAPLDHEPGLVNLFDFSMILAIESFGYPLSPEHARKPGCGRS